ncbi:hypothetical protein WJX81_001187 [Elliptochloris bilobata]|uniref:Uncharacterized protein n=1 Tax=Elliptochloris bilobata TaxID=381761 RepID=A0AAW1QVL0_9CHLO
MPPKKASARDTELDASDEDRLAAAEASRLQDAAFETLVLSKTRRICAAEVPPHRALVNGDGKDIVKRSAVRKNRYLLNVNAQLSAVAAGRMGTLAALDTKNPVLYIELTEGRLKFFGTLVFPKNRYLVLRFGQKDIVCEDVLENMVVFSEAWWVGTKQSNPEEKQLTIPESVLQAGAKAADTAAAANGAVGAAAAQPSQQTSRPRKRARPESAGASSSSDEDADAEEDEPPSTVRASQRNRGARPQYAVDSNDGSLGEDASGASEGAAPVGNNGGRSSSDSEPLAARASAARRKTGVGVRPSPGAACASVSAEDANEADAMGSPAGMEDAPVRKPAAMKARTVAKAKPGPKQRARAGAAGDAEEAISISSGEEESPSTARARRPARSAAGVAKAKLSLSSHKGGEGEEAEDDEAPSSASEDQDPESSL